MQADKPSERLKFNVNFQFKIMAEKNIKEKEVQGTVAPRRKLQKSYKSNTRIYEDCQVRRM